MISEQGLADRITQDLQLRNDVSRLRKLRELDMKAYKSLKTRLPYFVGSVFENNIRKSDYFKEANYLIMDIDDCLEAESTILKTIKDHPAVLLSFISPGGNGVKVVFRLASPCYSLEFFKEFYRNFSRHFADAVELAGSVDFRTCDATRACFLSYDESACYNPGAESVEWSNFVNIPLLLPDKDLNEEKTTREIDPLRLEVAMQKINPDRFVKKVFDGYVPDELLAMEEDVKKVCRENNLLLLDFASINYGKKVMVRQGYRNAEVNIFFGKKGYTVVRSPKKRTDLQLTEVLFTLMNELLFSTPEKGPEVSDFTPWYHTN